MTEHEIETRAERIMDGLDRRYMAGHLNATQYRACVDALETECKRLHGANRYTVGGKPHRHTLAGALAQASAIHSATGAIVSIEER